jgi:CHRD domain
MKKIRLTLLIFLALGMAAALAAAARNEFKATLTGGEIVPPVKTAAKGEADFKIGKDGKSVAYKLMVSNIEDVTAAHIHIGKKGENGPPAVFLFKGPEKKGKFSGTLGEGTITAKDFFGPLSGKPVGALVKMIESGDAYIVVHTAQNAAGEIRGQIK